MKKIIISAALMIGLSLTAQTTDQTLKDQLQALKLENTELTQQNIYFKQTLDLLKPMATNKVDGLRFDVLKLVGDRKNKTLKVFYLFTNTQGQNRDSFQPSSAHIVDPQGNQLLTYEVFAAPKQARGRRHSAWHPNERGSYLFAEPSGKPRFPGD